MLYRNGHGCRLLVGLSLTFWAFGAGLGAAPVAEHPGATPAASDHHASVDPAGEKGVNGKEAGADADKAAPAEPGTVSTEALTVEQIEAALAEAQQKRAEFLKPDPAAPNEMLAERWGVEVIGISQTAGGFMLDFRFRVVDEKKALPLFDHRIKPYITAERSGINLPVPVGAKTGAMRPTNRGKNIKADKTYYMVFANPDMHLKPGDKVSVVIGDFRVEHLTVN